MAQRLGIAAAMLGDPPVLMFDEPVNGLIQTGSAGSALPAIARRRGAGRARLESPMSELEDIADELVVIGRGA